LSTVSGDMVEAGKGHGARRKAWLGKACSRLKQEDGAAAALLREMEKRRRDPALGEAARERLDKSITYLRHNLSRMDYAERLRGNHPIASGVTEAACGLNPPRCQKAGVPQEHRTFRTKCELALELIQQARRQGLRYHYICADGAFGSNPPLLRALDDMAETFVMEVHCDQRLYQENPWPCGGPEVGGVAPLPLVKGNQPSRIDHWASTLPDTDWERVKGRDSTGGWVGVNYVSRRVWLWDGKEECARLWLALAWQNPDEGPKARIHYALSNTKADTPASELVKQGVHRYWIERTFQDGKSEAGMGDYQTRGWLGWHHHIALVMLAMLFLLKERLLHQPATGELPLSMGEIVFALSLLLPQRPGDLLEVGKMIQLRRDKRLTDQRRKRQKTIRDRPPSGPLEV
jgi:hypothetical protein